MKSKNKANIPGAVAKMIAVMGITVLLPQCDWPRFTVIFSASNRELHKMSLDYMSSLSEGLVNYWEVRQDGYIRVLRTLANIMADYEQTPAGERQSRYENMLRAVALSETEFAVLYTVWKSSAGQYNAAFTRENGELERRTLSNADIDTAMGYLQGPDSGKEHVEDPIPGQINGTDTYLVRMAVPIFNRSTKEVAGIVGCLWDIAAIQKGLEQNIRDTDAIAAMSIYSNNGLIMGSYVPARIGKNMRDVETLYGDYLKDAEQAVHKRMNCYFSSYSPILRTNVDIFMAPFYIGNSNTTWTIMIASTEEYFKRLYFLGFSRFF